MGFEWAQGAGKSEDKLWAKGPHEEGVLVGCTLYQHEWGAPGLQQGPPIVEGQGG